MLTYFQTFSNITLIDLIISFALIIYLIIFLIRFKLSKVTIIYLIISFVLIIASVIFDLELVKYITIIFLFVLDFLASSILTNQEKEALLRSPKKNKNKKINLTVNETDDLINKLTSTISFLSTTQTGALITIERNDDLSDILHNNGCKIDAPVSPELLETIFYKGTPLHDGATIIKGNMIIKSSVFYQPTQRPLSGKFGSRHRAALGISEICDALTIVVSEETGKVSFAFKGELKQIPVAKFIDELKVYLNK